MDSIGQVAFFGQTGFLGQAGFSLLEMVLVIVLVSILVGAGGRLLAMGFETYLTGRSLTALAEPGRMAMERIMVEVRGAGCLTLSQPMGNDSLQMVNNRGHILLFRRSPTQEETLTVQEGDDGEEKKLLTGVTAFDVQLQGCLATVRLTLRGPWGSHDRPISLPLRSACRAAVEG